MELFHRKFGQGPALIIVHGLYGSSDNWVGIGKVLSKYFEVYIIDQRNHGQSPHEAEHNYQALSSDLNEFMEKHQIQKAVLMGHSMGGKTVMQFTLDHPDKVSSLIVVDIAPKSYMQLNNFNQQTIDHLNIISAMKSVSMNEVNSRNEVDELLSEQIHSKRVRQFLLKNLKRNKDNSFHWGLNLEAISLNLNLIMGGFDPEQLDEVKEKLSFPVLFIKGENSNYILDEDIEYIQDVFPIAELERIPDSGHWVHAEQPELFMKKIKEFLIY